MYRLYSKLLQLIAELRYCKPPPTQRSHYRIDAYATTDRRPGSGRPKSVRTTDNIAVVQDLVCSQDDAPHAPVLCGAPYRSTKFAADLCRVGLFTNCRLCVPNIIRFG